MPNMKNYTPEEYSILLAASTLDASKGALFGKGGLLDPRTAGRAILIGLGGTGVRTIDYVKGVITRKLKETWEKHIAFLALDTDGNELTNARYLTSTEKLAITQPNAATRWSNPGQQSLAHRRYMIHADLAALDGHGAGRKRLIGKFKIHDQVAGALGIDKLIADKISNLVSEKLEALPAGGNDCYEVYVVGSVCGGTCSGAFLELPAMIKRGMGGRPFHVNGLLYLPDTLAGLDPNFRSELYANGYAALKELDYYQGISMRPGYPETFGINDDATPLISIPEGNDGHFFHIPYLVGSSIPGSPQAAQKAMDVVAQYLVSILGKMETRGNGGVTAPFSVESFMNNALQREGLRINSPANSDAEHEEHNHDRPRGYAAVGYAEACAPEKLVRAYSVAEICAKSGLAPVSKEERDTRIAHGETVLPFKGEDERMNANEGTAKAAELLVPVVGLLKWIHSVEFEFSADLKQSPVDWDRIKRGDFDSQAIQTIRENWVTGATSLQQLEGINHRISQAFIQYKALVQAFVEKEGPLAFFNLFKGRFIPVGDNYGMGIEAMLQNLCDGKDLTGRPYREFVTPEDALSTLKDSRNQINDTSKGLFNGPARTTQCANWVAAYNNWVKARVVLKRREHVTGPNGKFAEAFRNPAAIMADELRAFGYILDTLTDAYQGLGQRMTSFQEFSQSGDSLTEVNIAAVSTSAYQWLRDKADQTIATLNALELRSSIVQHFFEHPHDWLDIPDNRIANSGNGQVKLVAEDVAVPAREIFDEILAQTMGAMVTVSIEEMFVQLEKNGKSLQSTADDIVGKLVSYSVPQFHGNVRSDYIYVVYPGALNGSQKGSQIAQALQTAVQNAFPGMSPQILSSDDTGSIRMYQLAAPFELYQLQQLGLWEDNYEHKLLTDPNSGLHGLSPDLVETTTPGVGRVYSNRLGWKDYPAITRQKGDPRLPDPATGNISLEGQRRKEMDKIIDEARELGVLYCDQGADGKYTVYRVLCDKSIQWDKFDLLAMTPNAAGLLPLGKPLAEAVASLHGKNLYDPTNALLPDVISKPVRLAKGGIFETARPTAEQAWEACYRVLYAHIPMFIEIRNTVENHFRAWGKQIADWNDMLADRLKPAMMVRMIKAGRLYQRADGIWVLKEENEREKTIVNLSPMALNFMLPDDKRLVNNGMLGYFLFKKLAPHLPKTDNRDRFKEFYEFCYACCGKMIEAQDFASLQVGEDRAKFILDEAAALAELGANLAAGSTTPRFDAHMEDLGLTKDQLKDILAFYGRVGMEA